MTTALPNPWWQLMVGHQWPSSDSLALLELSARRRASASAEFEEYADALSSALTMSLAEQKGAAAEAAQSAFQRGVEHARQLAETNLAKSQSFGSAHAFLSELHSKLREIATRGEVEIRSIQTSDAPGPIKLNMIVATVAAAQLEANAAAADQATKLYSEIQQVITQNGMAISAREFSAAHGCDLADAWSSNSIDLTRERASALDNSLPVNSSPVEAEPADQSQGNSPMSTAAITDNGSVSGATERHLGKADTIRSPQPSTLQEVSNGTRTAENASNGYVSPPGARITESQREGSLVTSAPTTSDFIQNGSATSPASSSVSPPSTTIRSGISEGGTNAAGVPYPGAQAFHSSVPSGLPSEAQATPLAPTDLAHSFNAGTQAGAPVSIGAEATSSNALHTAHQTPTDTPVMSTPPVPPTVPLTTGTESAVAHAPVEPAAPPAVIAAPQAPIQTAVAAPPSIAVSTPAPPPSALPAYGADLRGAAATVPAASSTPAAPASAHLTSNPTGTLGQPSVVRHQSAPQAATTATALTERALAATATGSMAGAAALHSTAQQRLRQLLASVARQAPELGWAIGDRSDQTTLVTTDLASGWIPPNIRIPSGVALLAAGKRSGSLTSMLGETTLIATHLPGQHLPQDDADAPPTSTRPRKTAPVDELNWELAQATKWRDGLPRLAHTLARAIASGTGYLESEVRLLQEALDNAKSRTLDTYPNTDPDLIGNWQLLATIEALVSNETICANYHLAWFRTLSSTGSCER